MTDPRRPSLTSPPDSVEPPPVSATVNSVSTEDSDDALGEFESLLIRMLVGSIKFPFFRLPELTFRAVCRLFPTAVRVFRIVGLASVLFLVIVVPGVYGVAFDNCNDLIANHVPGSLYRFVSDHPLVLRAFCCFWSVVAVIGAIWGAIYARRKRTVRNS